MSAYVDDELTGVEMLEIRRHLGECESCAQEYESVRFVKHAVARLATVTPREDFAASIMAKLDEVSIPAYQRIIDSIMRVAHRKISPVAAALGACGLALVILSAGSMEPIQPEQTPQIAASTPYNLYVEPTDIIPRLPEGRVIAPEYGPVKVADQDPGLNGHTLELVAFIR